MELKRNIAWVRRTKPVLRADGVFGQTITMNPCPIVEGDTIYLFYAADDASGRRTIRVATAPVSASPDRPSSASSRNSCMQRW